MRRVIHTGEKSASAHVDVVHATILLLHKSRPASLSR